MSVAQLDLIDRPAITRARAAGHEGARLAAEKTQRVVDPDWCEKAVEAIRTFAAHQSGLFTAEMARGVIELQGTVARPCDLRAWGAAVQLALRRKFIEATTTYFPAVSSNGAVRRCYKKGRAA
jgi:hypothetical protein